MNLACTDKSSGNGRAATRASYGSNNFERIEGPQLPNILYKIVQSLKFSKDCKIVMKDYNHV